MHPSIPARGRSESSDIDDDGEYSRGSCPEPAHGVSIVHKNSMDTASGLSATTNPEIVIEAPPPPPSIPKRDTPIDGSKHVPKKLDEPQWKTGHVRCAEAFRKERAHASDILLEF